jgi:hypothetical protein
MGLSPYNIGSCISFPQRRLKLMQPTTPGKLALKQEVLKNLTDNPRFEAGRFSHNCPPSVGFPACTPAIGAK